MCDQTEVSYLPNQVVWVKLNKVWWPAQVEDQEKLDEEVTSGLKKTPLAIVKFFNEDYYEFIKNLNQIYHYNCRQKNDFIRKGLDLCRAEGKRDVPSSIKKFPEDVITAERLTNGNPDIIHDPMFLPEEKIDVQEVLGFKKVKTPQGKNLKRQSTSSLQNSDQKNKSKQAMLKKDSNKISSLPQIYNDTRNKYFHKQHDCYIRIQKTSYKPKTVIKCGDCSFVTPNLYLAELHSKLHSTHDLNGIPLPVGRKMDKNQLAYFTPRPEIVVTSKRKSANLSTPIKRRKQQQNSPELPPVRKRARKANKEQIESDSKLQNEEIRENILKDWDFDSSEEHLDDSAIDGGTLPVGKSEDSCDKFTPVKLYEDSSSFDQFISQASSIIKLTNTEQTSIQNVCSTPKPAHEKSCFDFEDNEDSINLDTSLKFGQKLPRVISDEKPTKKQVEYPIFSPNIEDDNKNSELLSKEFTDLLEDTQVPQLPELPKTLITSTSKSAGFLLESPKGSKHELEVKDDHKKLNDEAQIPKKALITEGDNMEAFLREQLVSPSKFSKRKGDKRLSDNDNCAGEIIGSIETFADDLLTESDEVGVGQDENVEVPAVIEKDVKSPNQKKSPITFFLGEAASEKIEKQQLTAKEKLKSPKKAGLRVEDHTHKLVEENEETAKQNSDILPDTFELKDASSKEKDNLDDNKISEVQNVEDVNIRYPKQKNGEEIQRESRKEKIRTLKLDTIVDNEDQQVFLSDEKIKVKSNETKQILKNSPDKIKLSFNPMKKMEIIKKDKFQLNLGETVKEGKVDNVTKDNLNLVEGQGEQSKLKVVELTQQQIDVNLVKSESTLKTFSEQNRAVTPGKGRIEKNKKKEEKHKEPTADVCIKQDFKKKNDSNSKPLLFGSRTKKPDLGSSNTKLVQDKKQLQKLVITAAISEGNTNENRTDKLEEKLALDHNEILSDNLVKSEVLVTGSESEPSNLNKLSLENTTLKDDQLQNVLISKETPLTIDPSEMDLDINSMPIVMGDDFIQDIKPDTFIDTNSISTVAPLTTTTFVTTTTAKTVPSVKKVKIELKKAGDTKFRGDLGYLNGKQIITIPGKKKTTIKEGNIAIKRTQSNLSTSKMSSNQVAANIVTTNRNIPVSSPSMLIMKQSGNQGTYTISNTQLIGEDHTKLDISNTGKILLVSAEGPSNGQQITLTTDQDNVLSKTTFHVGTRVVGSKAQLAQITGKTLTPGNKGSNKFIVGKANLVSTSKGGGTIQLTKASAQSLLTSSTQGKNIIVAPSVSKAMVGTNTVKVVTSQPKYVLQRTNLPSISGSQSQVKFIGKNQTNTFYLQGSKGKQILQQVQAAATQPQTPAPVRRAIPTKIRQASPNILQKSQRKGISRQPIKSVIRPVTTVPIQTPVTQTSDIVTFPIVQNITTEQPEQQMNMVYFTVDGNYPINNSIVPVQTSANNLFIETNSSTDVEKLFYSIDGNVQLASTATIPVTTAASSGQDILAKALANTQVLQNETSDSMDSTTLMEVQQYPPLTMSHHNILGTSFTINQPIMTPQEVPSSITLPQISTIAQNIIPLNNDGDKKIDIQPSMPLLTDDLEVQAGHTLYITENLPTTSNNQQLTIQVLNDVDSDQNLTAPSVGELRFTTNEQIPNIESKTIVAQPTFDNGIASETQSSLYIGSESKEETQHNFEIQTINLQEGKDCTKLIVTEGITKEISLPNVQEEHLVVEQVDSLNEPFTTESEN